MAKLPALVTALARVDGRERKSVDHIARIIRERGYITTGKRGGGAAEMTAREAANLIIALNGADTPKDAPTAIDRFRSLVQYIEGGAEELRARVDSYDEQINPIKDVMDVHTFGEALDALIEGVPDILASLLPYVGRVYQETDRTTEAKYFGLMLRSRIVGPEIIFKRYDATIRFYTMDGHERRLQFETNFKQDPDRDDGFYGREYPDRHVSVSIGMLTLIAAWQALNPDKSRLSIADSMSTPEEPEVCG